MTYLRRVQKKETPQSEAILGSSQVPNSAGGFSWKVDDWKQLDRFLVLGSQGGTYYISQQKLTKDNAEALIRCIAQDGLRTVRRIVDISEQGRAPKNDPALFALAACAALGDIPTKHAAFEALPKVARIGTHLLHFAAYVEGFRGWGRGLRNAIGNWYLSKTPEQVAFQVTKYSSRDDWSHRDLLRLSHPHTENSRMNVVLNYAVGKQDWAMSSYDIVSYLVAVQELQQATTEQQAAALVAQYQFPMELVPTDLKKSKLVWEAALPHLGLTALIRNLGNLTRYGVIGSGQWEANKQVVARISDEAALKKARIHPISVLAALHTYSRGQSTAGSRYGRSEATWEPVGDVVDALDTAFYKAFRNVEPTGKRMVLALDVSGSMAMTSINGLAGITARDGAAAMAMVTYQTEPNVEVITFQDQILPFSLSRKTALRDVIKAIDGLVYGSTDCAQPMLWALKNNVQADMFVVYTDSETWYGKIHPSQALQKYRRETGIPAKLVVVGMCSNGFTIADPNDAGMMDIVGFDSAAPEIMSMFAKGEV